LYSQQQRAGDRSGRQQRAGDRSGPGTADRGGAVTAAERDRPGAEGERRSGRPPSSSDPGSRAAARRGSKQKERPGIEAEEADPIEDGGWDTGQTGNPEDEADVTRPT
jgi:hypothetical protein